MIVQEPVKENLELAMTMDVVKLDFDHTRRARKHSSVNLFDSFGIAHMLS